MTTRTISDTLPRFARSLVIFELLRAVRAGGRQVSVVRPDRDARQSDGTERSARYARQRRVALGASGFSACAKGYHQAPSDVKGVPSRLTAPPLCSGGVGGTLRALDIGTFLDGIKPLRRQSLYVRLRAYASRRTGCARNTSVTSQEAPGATEDTNP
jgi:hypothetical protein